MSRFLIAHLRQQGQDMIIVPLDRSFGYKSQREQNEITCALQLAASAAGLAGTVVPVWDHGSGRMAFIAPSPWRPFFQNLSQPVIGRMINRELICA
jgi:hypothetical protein